MLNKDTLKILYAHKHRNWDYNISNKKLTLCCNRCGEHHSVNL